MTAAEVLKMFDPDKIWTSRRGDRTSSDYEIARNNFSKLFRVAVSGISYGGERDTMPEKFKPLYDALIKESVSYLCQGVNIKSISSIQVLANLIKKELQRKRQSDDLIDAIDYMFYGNEPPRIQAFNHGILAKNDIEQYLVKFLFIMDTLIKALKKDGMNPNYIYSKLLTEAPQL